MSRFLFLKDAMILFAITLVAGAGLGAVNHVTEGPIERAKQEAKAEARRTVFPEVAQFLEDDYSAALAQASEELEGLGIGSTTLDECVTAADASGEKLGYVVTATSKGYNGGVTVSVGIASDGTIRGIEFLTLAETPGLGMKAGEPEFKDQFAGKNAQRLKVSKTGASSGDEIDAISGATITSTAVTNAVNASLHLVNGCLEGQEVQK